VLFPSSKPKFRSYVTFFFSDSQSLIMFHFSPPQICSNHSLHYTHPRDPNGITGTNNGWGLTDLQFHASCFSLIQYDYFNSSLLNRKHKYESDLDYAVRRVFEPREMDVSSHSSYRRLNFNIMKQSKGLIFWLKIPIKWTLLLLLSLWQILYSQSEPTLCSLLIMVTIH